MHSSLASATRVVAAIATIGCSQAIPAPSPERAFAPRGGVYVVQRGDTLSSIAARLGTSVATLVDANGLADPNRLAVGQRLTIPSGAHRTAAKPRKQTRVVSSRPPTLSSAPPVAVPPPTPSRRGDTASLASDSTAPLLAVDRAIIDTDQRLRSAHFEETIDAAHEARSLLRPLRSEPGAAERSARIEVLCAMAEIALERDAAARASFERALAADPGLTLAPDEVSPKVLRLFEETRKQVAARQASH